MGGENKYSTSGPGIKKQCFYCQGMPSGKLCPGKGFLNPKELIFPHQHVAVFNVEVEEEEERDEEAEEGDGGALPKTPHLVQGFPHQPHAVHALTGICGGRKNKTGNEKLSFLGMSAALNNQASADCRGYIFMTMEPRMTRKSPTNVPIIPRQTCSVSALFL